MNKIIVSKFLIISLMISISVFVAVLIVAAQKEDIQYPIAELGNCKNESACRTYCDKPANMLPCLDFAEGHRLISEEDAAKARKFAKIGKGPGGCVTEDACETYCDDVIHLDECLAFAEKNDFISLDELAEAKKVQAVLAKGAKMPGNCKNKKECDIYCNDPAYMEECITFGEAAGFIPPEELEDARKALAAIKKGAKAPPCRGKKECDVYCGEPEHMEECITFGEAAGFIPPEELEDAKKMLQAIKRGVKPPPCRGKEECDKWCVESDENMARCIEFAAAAGFMSEEEAEMARKTGGKGPGGCRGKEKCEAFCQDSANQETCFNFAKENGLISEEELAEMEEGKARMREGLEMAPPEVLECLKSAVGAELLEKLQAGTAMPSRDLGDQMRKCFEEFMPGPPEGMPGEMPPGVTGPGGCKSMEECKSYCQENPDECQEFMQRPVPSNGQGFGEGMPSGGGMPPGIGGPGGCRSAEECASYCQKNPEECQEFIKSMPSEGMPGGKAMPLREGEGEKGMPPENFESGQMPPVDFQQMPKIPTPEDIERIKREQMQKFMPSKEMMPPEGMMPQGPMQSPEMPTQQFQPMSPQGGPMPGMPGGMPGGPVPAPQPMPEQTAPPQSSDEPPSLWGFAAGILKEFLR